MEPSIFETLNSIGVATENNRQLFNRGTRDVEDLQVWRDAKSGVIYIDNFFTGNDQYINGLYHEQQYHNLGIDGNHFDKSADAERRVKSYLKLVSGKNLVEFGCGSGEFLKSVKPFCNQTIGIELQESYLEGMNAAGITCFNDIKNIENQSVDILSSFHVIEHLPNPIETLTQIRKKIAIGGKILIEVPHANDFLLSTVHCEQFKKFTLWSQHLILHTRESLRRLLEYVGFQDVLIEGVQRYRISNHLNWLANGKPGGNNSPLSILDTDALSVAYENSLARINATDTLVAIANNP